MYVFESRNRDNLASAVTWVAGLLIRFNKISILCICFLYRIPGHFIFIGSAHSHRRASSGDVGDCQVWYWEYNKTSKYFIRLRWIHIVCIKFSELKLIKIVIFWVYYTICFDFSLCRNFFGIIFQLFELLCLAKDHWREFSRQTAHMVQIVISTRYKMVYIS